MANEALKEFAKWAIRESAFTGYDLHGADVHDKAHALGLLEKTTYNSAIHGPSDCADEGDEWFVFTATLSSDAVAGGEPVAWRTYCGGYLHTSRPEIAAEWGKSAEPLYASPPELDQLRDRVKELEKASREKFYYPIVMPVNSEGQGPADLRDAVKLTWEVWDQEMMSHGSFDFLIDAVDLANELNARRVREG